MPAWVLYILGAGALITALLVLWQGGSRLRRAADRIEKLARDGRVDADILKVGAEASRLLAQLDREKLDRFILLLDKLTTKVDAGVATVNRIENHATEVAEDLAAAHKPTRMESDGTYSWIVHQGCFLTEEEAKADAARYAHGYVVPNVPLGRSLTADVAAESSIYFAKSKEEMNRPGISLSMVQDEVDGLRRDIKMAAARTT